MKMEVRMSGSSGSGFTLIEILVSLALLTVVLGAVYSSFFSVQRAMDRFDGISLKYHDARTALDIMRREIEASVAERARKSEEPQKGLVFVMKDRDIFGRSASELDLSAYTFKENNLNVVSYFVREKDGKLDLLKKEAPAAAPSREYEAEIIEAIDGFSVETLYNDKWVKTWDSSETGMLPEIVRIRIEFDDNGQSVILTEYARPRIGTRL